MIIAITIDRRNQGPSVQSTKIRPSRPEVFLKENMISMLRDLGIDVLLLPPESSNEALGFVCSHCDGVIISGGAFDIDPKHYGQSIMGRIDSVDEGRSAMELRLAKLCIEQNIPLLGICGGMQAMIVANGGSLIQDIGTQIPNALEHEQPTDPAQGWHAVEFLHEKWKKWFEGDSIMVNSTHHQAVDALGSFVVTGLSTDGVVEAVEYPDADFCVGVQWHPELLDNRIFKAFQQAILNKQQS